MAVAALDGWKYPCWLSLLAASAGLRTPAYPRLTCLESELARGELGLDGILLRFSGTAVGGLKLSNCLEYLLLAGGVGIDRPELRGLGEPDEEGVNASRPAKES